MAVEEPRGSSGGGKGTAAHVRPCQISPKEGEAQTSHLRRFGFAVIHQTWKVAPPPPSLTPTSPTASSFHTCTPFVSMADLPVKEKEKKKTLR